MALLNSQYDRIMRSYDLQRAENARELDERTEEVCGKIPRIRELNDRTGTLAVQYARAEILGEKTDPAVIDASLKDISDEKKRLLAAGGYPDDYLETQYRCPVCKDTGFVNGEKCICFRRAEIRLLYDQYELGDILKEENFAHFSFDCYSDTMMNETTMKSARQTAQEAYAYAQEFVSGVGHTGCHLYLYGNTGVGKTFLSHCIAKEVLDRSYATLYFSAHDFFSLLTSAEFERKAEASSYGQMITDCDLLIIDDLGTELTNTLVSSQLFYVINTRILRKHSTIISTNLGLKEFSDRYSERTLSRITSNFEMIKLTGKDIRLQKKYQGGSQ